MVATTREQNWIIYSLLARRAVELQKNLKCLQDCVQTDPVFKRDLKKLAKLRQNCCPELCGKKWPELRRLNCQL